MNIRQLNSKLASLIFAFFYTMGLGFSVQADDTEIYFGANTSSIIPNILFVMDTSGSMSTEVGNTGKDRLEVLQESLVDLIGSMSNVNVGMMRYSSPDNYDNNGGPVLYPVRYIDDSASEPKVTSSVEQGSDDAVENLTIPLAPVNLSGGVISMTDYVADGLVNGVTEAVPDTSGNDFVTYTINVTPGASNLKIETIGSGSGDADLYIKYGSAASSGSYDCRGYTGDSSEVCIIASPSVGTYYITVFAYSNFNSVSITASFDGGVVTPPVAASQLVGLRFNTVDIPSGATITSAYIEFVAANSDTVQTDLVIHAQKTINSPTFSVAPVDISTRAKTSAQATWGSVGDWSNGSTYRTPEIKNVVQEVVDLTGWCGGNPMSFIFSGTGTRRFASFDKDPGSVPRLVVEFDNASAVGGCVNASIVKQINGNKDDAKEKPDGTVKTGNTLTVKTDWWTGLRFNDINIPQGATISSASISFTASEGRSSALNSRIYHIDEDNPGQFKTSPKYDISSRSDSTPVVSWSEPAWTPNDVLETPNIASLVQEIVNRTNWASENSMAFALEHPGSDGGKLYSYDSSPGKSAILRINYTGSYVVGGVTVRKRLQDIVNDFTHSGYTPISGTLAEAALYYGAGDVTFGAARGDNRNSSGVTGSRQFRVSHPDSWTGGSHTIPSGCPGTDSSDSDCAAETITGASYISPISGVCETNTNHIVFLSDGQPNSHGSETASIIENITGTACSSSDSGKECSKDLATFLSSTDQSSAHAGDQKVITHTISFGSNIALLDEIAAAGGGGSYTATTAGELTKAFEEILTGTLSTTSSFVSAGVTVNQFNRLTNADELYFSLFKPNDDVVWPGNLKRYRFDADTNAIVDYGTDGTDGKDAVDANGSFTSDAVSFWNAPTVDGNEVGIGGVAYRLTTSRNVYTNMGSSNVLTNVKNAVNESNADITTSLLGVSDATERSNVLKWARGLDVNDVDEDSNTTEARREMGDPLHSRPIIVTYDNTTTAGESRVFVGTNQGYLHNINTSNGNEMWSFIPKTLLSNLRIYQQEINGVKHPYGLDGSISVLHEDTDHDAKVDETETAIMYVGMRRGGSNYYAIDISKKDAPKLLFVIEGGSGDFAELGETWSKVNAGKIQWNGVSTPKKVIIFGGGYDDSQDTEGGLPISDSVGRTVFVADALTGARLWSAKINAVAPTASSVPAAKTKLTNSIPADVRTLDLSNDGLVDTIYASDTAAQLFRFDINKENKGASDFAVGGRIAHLNENTVEGNRRFYYAPDLSLVIRPNGEKYVAMAIGSGYRAHPLNSETEEHFYVMKDLGVLNGPVFDADISLSDLADVSVALTEADAAAAIDSSAGVDTARTDAKDALIAGTQEYDDAYDKAYETAYNEAYSSEYYSVYAAEVAGGASHVDADAAAVVAANIEATIAGTAAGDAAGSSAGTLAGDGAASKARAEQKGWYLDLSIIGFTGEKVVAPSITLNNTVIFSTYVPAAKGSAASACAASEGSSLSYMVNVTDGRPLVVGDPLNPVKEDRYTPTAPGISTGASLLVTEGSVIVTDSNVILDTPPPPSGKPMQVYGRHKRR